MPVIYRTDVFMNVPFKNPEQKISALLWAWGVFLFPTPPSIHPLLPPILWLLFSPAGVRVSSACCEHHGPPPSHGAHTLRSAGVPDPEVKESSLVLQESSVTLPGERGDGDGLTWSLLGADVAVHTPLSRGKNLNVFCLRCTYVDGTGTRVIVLDKVCFLCFCFDFNLRAFATSTFLSGPTLKAHVCLYFEGSVCPWTPPGENLGELSPRLHKYEVGGQRKTR